MNPSTLYELAGVPEDVPADLVHSAALVEGGADGPMASVALAVLADAGARADYDARSSQGLAFELALAWGLASMSAGDGAAAYSHLDRARRISPDDRAVPLLLDAIDAEAPPLAAVAEEKRAEARREIARLRNNSAFPHRLVRYAAALAGEPDSDGAGDSGVMANAARELLQYDVTEAPRSYAMVLPVLREHYPAVYELDAPFFDATMAVLADHAPAAEYERGKRRHRDTGAVAPKPADTPPSLDLSQLRLPPLRIPERRLSLPALPRPGYAWIGAVVGALITWEDGPEAILTGAIIGFVLAYALVYAFRKR